MPTKKTTGAGASAPVEPDKGPEVDLIASEIRKAREGANLSILELSARTGISKTVLHGYERGRTKPGAREIRLICGALNVSPNRLLFGLDEFGADRGGFAKLMRLSRSSPMVTIAISTMIFPMALAVLDEQEAESLMVLVTSLVRSKDQDIATKIIDIVEVMSEELDVASGKMNDPPNTEAMARIQRILTERWEGKK